jgi:aldehyde:ferredoxin oxidoreductase
MVADLEPMLEEYYKLRRWDSKTGWIPSDVLKKFGLSDVADELGRLGKLP